MSQYKRRWAQPASRRGQWAETVEPIQTALGAIDINPSSSSEAKDLGEIVDGSRHCERDAKRVPTAIGKMTPNNFKFIDLFAGIGGLRIPFDSLGGECVFSSEIDPYCQKTYEANFGDKPRGDITTIDPKSIPDHDILLAGFPCQAFSIIGDQKGFADTRGTLFFNIEEILREKRPQAFLLENVKQLVTHDRGRTYKTIDRKLKELGYRAHTKILSSLDFGVPQKRERIYIVGFLEKNDFRFPAGGKPYDLKNILESDRDVPKRYHASDYIVRRRGQAVKENPPRPGIWHENKSGNVSALPYSCALRASASYNYLLVNGVRRLTEREMLRLQGFPESFNIVLSYSQTRKQVGNAVTVPVVEAVAKQMLTAKRIEPRNEKNSHYISECESTVPDSKWAFCD